MLILYFDDKVLDKRFSEEMEIVRRQYSGNEHRVVRGCLESIKRINEASLLSINRIIATCTNVSWVWGKIS